MLSMLTVRISSEEAKGALTSSRRLVARQERLVRIMGKRLNAASSGSQSSPISLNSVMFGKRNDSEILFPQLREAD